MEETRKIARGRAMNTPVHSSSEGDRRRKTPGKVARILESRAGDLQRTARRAMSNPVRAKVLRLLAVHPNGVQYRDLCNALPVTDRWVRAIVRDLRSDGVIETPGNPAQIQFCSRSMAVAVKELLAFIASDWVGAITGNDRPVTALEKFLDGSDSEPSRYLKSMVKIIRGDGGAR